MMYFRIFGLLLAALTMSAVVVACGGTDDEETNPTVAIELTSTPASGASGMDHGTMGTPVDDADPDLVFIDAMIVHHDSAIVMAEVARNAAERTEISNLADEIIREQKRETDQMMQWRDAWYPDAPLSDLSHMMSMSGMHMADADMDMLRHADDFDLMFIDMMIPHHESAIEMARNLQQTTERPELQQLAEDIIVAQQAEIEQMRQWRDEWAGE
jgi:uncharacterized protein (DUF305 family)